MSRALLPAALLVVVALGLAPEPVAAEEGVRYPLPPDIAAVLAGDEDRALRDAALAALEPGDTAVRDLDWPRRLLLLLGDVGLRAACERLANGNVPRHLMPHLLQIVAVSAHQEADLVLAEAAKEPRPLLRMIAAHGLGRGRTSEAVPLLAVLARDERSGVRAAALTSLFALDTPQAVEARLALPRDAEPKLFARRLEWHRRARDASAALHDMALDTYHHSKVATTRSEAAHVLTDSALATHPDILWRIVLEMGTGILGEWLVRYGLDTPVAGYDPVKGRRIAIDAALTLLAHPDATDEQRRKTLDLAVGWIAAPVPMDPYRRDPIPELELRRRLPDLGEIIVPPVLRRLQAGTFYEPSHGIVLLRELGEDVALRELVKLLDPDIHGFDPALDAYARSATERSAADVLDEFGRVGGEHRAARLLEANDVYVREHVLLALEREDGAFVVPLLEQYLFTDRLRTEGKLPFDERSLRHAARRALADRDELEARKILTEDLFATADDPPRWLAPLVRPFDEIGWTTLERALFDSRELFRRVALSVLANPVCKDPRAAELVRRFIPRADLTQNIAHKLLTAMVTQIPEEAVTFVRTNWQQLPSGHRALEQLAPVRGKAASEAAVDLAFEALTWSDDPDEYGAAAGAVLAHRWDHRHGDVTAFWRAMLQHDDDDFVTQAVRALDDSRCPDMTDLLVPLFNQARSESALDDEGAENEAALGQDILSAFEHQPWTPLESAVIKACFDPVAHPEVRSKAARLLVGRVSKAGRPQLLRWMTGHQSAAGPEPADGVKPEGAKAEAFLQEMIALAIGTAGGERAAGALYAALDRELRQYLAVATHLDPDGQRAYELAPRASALARGIVRTRHEPSIRGLVDLLLRPELGLYAGTAAKRQRALVNPGGLGTPLDTASPLDYLRHEIADLYRVVPPEADAILSRVSAAADDVLARAFHDTLSRARRGGAIAMFPDLYLLKISQSLRDGRDHERRPRAAEVVETFAEPLAPAGSVADYAMARQQVDAHVRNGRYGAALRAQSRAVEIVSRRGYTDDEDTLWVQGRVRLDAIRGMDYVARGLGVLARDSFRRAVMRRPNDVGVLSIVARHRAAARFDLDLAEAEARRALVLEQRSQHEARLGTVDVLVDVLLAQGKSDEAVELLLPRLHDRPASFKNARYFLRLAAAFLAAGERDNAEVALVKALTGEPGLMEEALRDPEFEPLRADGGLDQVRSLARLARREGL